jgi:hypothetical protein
MLGKKVEKQEDEKQKVEKSKGSWFFRKHFLSPIRTKLRELLFRMSGIQA